MLWDAYGAAPVIERRERDGHWFEYRRVHELLLERLLACGSADQRAPLLALSHSCARGFPDPLAEVLARCLAALHERGDHTSNAAIYDALGELPLAHDSQIRALLGKAALADDAAAARAAAIALYRVVVPAAVRYQNWSTVLFAEHIQPVLDARPAGERLLICLAVASLFRAGELHGKPRWMTYRSADGHRCTECRKRFHPVVSARHSQRVCSAACRKARDRALARTRRDRDLHGYREDERRRQADRRRRTKSAVISGVTGPPGTPRHAPSSAAKPLDLLKKVLQIGDRETARSRATLAQLLACVAGESRGTGGFSEATVGPLSRATLGAQPSGISEDS